MMDPIKFRNILGSIDMDDSSRPDNLAVALATYFDMHPDKPDDDPKAESGWSEWVETEVYRVLDEIAKTSLAALAKVQP